jgi:nitrite reductase/ring-hydroxylating ferredoxin subunit/uncharacterized membrane protein
MAARPEDVGLGQAITKGMPWLDGVAEVMENAFDPLLGQDAPREPRDFLYGVWFGHPLHAAVVMVPLGAWTSAMVLDLLHEESAADAMVGLGLLGAAGAAITGAAQWQDTTNEEAPRRLGTLHALLNYGITGLMAGSYIMRKRGRRGTGLALSTAGLALSVASGWLGGELAYTLGIGVDHTAFEKPPAEWTEVAALADLQDGMPLRVETDDAPVMLLRQGDDIRAIAATCPHLGGPLDEGKIEGETVACPWHNSVFSLVDGSVLHGPAMMPVTAYEVRIDSGMIMIRANADQPGGKVPA